MNAAIAHRGPDGEDIWIGDDAGLGHRRLSIIDLSAAGSQPMASADGRYRMVCNGEIYNYREVRQRFATEGYRFRSATDVEVILPLYARYGERCVDHLAGMFAFAIWDTVERTLFLARDRIGEKPLYLWTQGSALAFCSEIKGLLALPFVERKVDERAIGLLPTFQSLPAPTTIFAGIEALPGATTLTWKDGRQERRRYWRLDFSRRRPWRWADALDAYDETLRRTVNGCLVADVPLGITLSGGVDSSAIAALARRDHPDLRSFCIGHSVGGILDIEQQRASRVAELLDLQHANLNFDLPEFASLTRVLGHYDQPMWCGVALYADRLAETMRRQVKVAVSGNGADEVLAGYRPYSRMPFEAALRRLISCAPDGVLGADIGLPERVRRLARSSRGPMETWRAETLAEAARTQIRQLCTPAVANRLLEQDLGAPIRAYAEECTPSSYLDTVLYTDLMAYHQHGHCTIADMSGMTYGLEIRAPFLDHRFVEFAASLPTHMLLSVLPAPQRTKQIAKRHLERYLPRDVVQAPKVGFGYAIPLNDMILGSNREAVRKRLTQGAYLDLGIFSREGAEWALAHSSSATWMLLSFSIWTERHLGGIGGAAEGAPHQPPKSAGMEVAAP